MNPIFVTLVMVSAVGAWAMRDDAEAPADSTKARLRSVLGVFLILQILDLCTTLAVFRAGGFELNPVVRAFMPWTGRTAAIVISKIVIVALMYLLSRRLWLVRFGNIFYSGVVLWNIWIFHSLKASSG